MAGFNQMGGLPTGYSDLLNSARQQLVKLPDGTYTVAPQFGGSTNINDLYQGIYPSSPPPVPGPLTSRSVNTVPIDPMTGNPLGFSAPSSASTRAEQSGARPAFTVGTQPAGTVAMPPGARPASIDRAFAQMPRPPQTTLAGMFGRGQGGYWSGALKDQAQLPSNDGGEAGFLQAFGPGAPASPAVTAIDQAAGMPPMPRIRPIPPAQIPLTSITAPQPAGNPPQVPGAITFRKGDTVSALAKKLGMTTASFADRYGITNPNRIYAGQTVAPVAGPMPLMPPAGLNRAPPTVPMPRLPPQALNRSRQIAEGKASQLDEFGMIR
jgi:hypothetical protein